MSKDSGYRRKNRASSRSPSRSTSTDNDKSNMRYKEEKRLESLNQNYDIFHFLQGC